jgi:hypothetical protein
MSLEYLTFLIGKAAFMTELRKRMLEDLKLAGLAPKSHRLYIWAVRQLAAYYMTPPDQLSERQVQEYLLYVRDELGCAKGTFSVTWAGIKFFYYRTLGYDWPLLTKKKFASPAASGCRTSAPMPIAAA